MVQFFHDVRAEPVKIDLVRLGRAREAEREQRAVLR
jgi:hypothetical protein